MCVCLDTVEGLKERCENSHSCALVQQSAVSTQTKIQCFFFFADSRLLWQIKQTGNSPHVVSEDAAWTELYLGMRDTEDAPISPKQIGSCHIDIDRHTGDDSHVLFMIFILSHTLIINL